MCGSQATNCHPSGVLLKYWVQPPTRRQIAVSRASSLLTLIRFSFDSVPNLCFCIPTVCLRLTPALVSCLPASPAQPIPLPGSPLHSLYPASHPAQAPRFLATSPDLGCSLPATTLQIKSFPNSTHCLLPRCPARGFTSLALTPLIPCMFVDIVKISGRWTGFSIKSKCQN